MALISRLPSYNNLSLCVYIGNTATINDDILLNYCSQFGSIVTCSFSQEKFCDFRIVEYVHYEQLKDFLEISNHQINKRYLDVKLYNNILINNEILNIDRKLYIGPILNKNDIHPIAQFYQKHDSKLQYCIIKQDEEDYLLLEFSNRQFISRIYEKNIIPFIIEQRKCFMYKPLHPKKLINKIISMKNKRNQIHIHGLTRNITDEMLINYFHKCAPVIACHMLSNDPTLAVIEFNDEQTVRKILDSSSIRLQGVTLQLSQASHSLSSLLYSTNDDDDDDDREKRPILNSIQIQNPSPQSSLNTSDIVHISSPVHSESGWTSPPRTIVHHCLPIDSPTVQSLPSTSTTNTSMTTDQNTDIDIKPIRQIPSNNLLQFVEQYQNELEQIKDDYMSKFAKDRTYIEQEINLLVKEERRTFENLNRYLNDHRTRVEKRKYTSSSSYD